MTQGVFDISQTELDLTETLRLVAAKDRAALKALYDRTGAALLEVLVAMVCHRARAENLLVASFVTIWQTAHQFDAARDRPNAWLLSVVRGEASGRLRGDALMRPIVADTSPSVAGRDSGQNIERENIYELWPSDKTSAGTVVVPPQSRKEG